MAAQRGECCLTRRAAPGPEICQKLQKLTLCRFKYEDLSHGSDLQVLCKHNEVTDHSSKLAIAGGKFSARREEAGDDSSLWHVLVSRAQPH